MIAAACALAMACSGCATQNAGKVTSDQDKYSAVEKATLTTRTVTFPAGYFQDMTTEEVLSLLSEKGYTDVAANDNGSYSVTMSVSDYNEMVDTMHSNVAQYLDSMVSSGDWPTLSAVEFDDQFSKVKLTTTSTSLGFKEAFAPLAAGITSCMYQQIAGQPVSCNVVIVDEEGIELANTTYPDAFDDDIKDNVVAN